jgi:uncharacterized membrane protein
MAFFKDLYFRGHNKSIMVNNSSRPKVLIKLSDREKAKEKIGIWLILIIWTIIITAYFRLPQQVPEHINFKNQVDSWADAKSIFLLPGICTLLYIVLSILNRFPQYFNYTEEVTPENAERLYTMGTRLIRNIKLAVVLGFGIESMNFILIAQHPDFCNNPLSIAMQWAPVIIIFSAALSVFISKKKTD